MVVPTYLYRSGSRKKPTWNRQENSGPLWDFQPSKPLIWAVLWIRIRISGSESAYPDPNPHQFADDKPKWRYGKRAYLSTFKVLSLYLEARIRIRNRIKVKDRIRIRIKVTSRIRIRINVMRIRKTESGYRERKEKKYNKVFSVLSPSHGTCWLTVRRIHLMLETLTCTPFNRWLIIAADDSISSLKVMIFSTVQRVSAVWISKIS